MTVERQNTDTITNSQTLFGQAPGDAIAGGIECVVSAQRQQFYSLAHTHLRLLLQGEVTERAIDGFVRIAGQELPFRLHLE